MAEAFDISRVNASPARFDLKKCTALNADWIRLLDGDEFVARLVSFLRDQRGVVLDAAGEQTVRAAAELVQERVETLGQAADMLHFLLVDEAAFTVDPEDAAKQLTADSEPVLEAAYAALSDLEVWSTEAIEAALRAALIDGLELKPRVAFGPVRVAVSGRRVSPPLFESLEILGKERSLARLTAALHRAGRLPDQGRFGRAMPGWVSSGACRNFSAPMGYGVIGSPTVSGSVSLGSSPGTPARWSSCPPGYCFLTSSPARPVPLGQIERDAEYARPRCVAA